MKLSIKNLSLTTLICSLSLLIPSTINSNLKNLKNENQITVNLNLNVEKDFNGTDSCTSAVYPKQKIISWDQYTSTWTEFTKKYNVMNFDSDSSFGVYCQYAADTVNGTQMNVNTNEIPDNDNTCTYGVSIDYEDLFVVFVIVKMEANFYIYHDDHDIFYKMDYTQLSWDATRSSKFWVKINTITF